MKMHGFHGNRLYDSQDGGGGGGRPTNSIISRVLLIPEHQNWCQIKAYTHVFLLVVRFVNHLICIFMNINENLQK